MHKRFREYLKGFSIEIIVGYLHTPFEVRTVLLASVVLILT